MSQYRATVQIHYPIIEATIAPNYNSGNRKFRDEVVLSDVTIFTFNKNINDIVTVEDVRSILVQKKFTDVVTVTENILIEINGTVITVIIPTALVNGAPLNTRTLN